MNNRLYGILLGLIIGILAFSVGMTTRELLYREDIVGEVHLMRDRQMYLKFNIKGVDKLTANKLVSTYSEIERRALEASDPNVYFFGGHPNERVGIFEFEWIPWVMMSIWIIGLMVLVIWINEISKFILGGYLLALAWAIQYQTITNRAIIPIAVVMYLIIARGCYVLFNILRDAKR